jgi:hypothetical protein
VFADINDVYLYCNFLLNKNQSGSFSGNEFNICINAAQQQYFRTKLGLPEMYQVGAREAPQQFQSTQSNSDSLKPFIVTADINKSGKGFNLPANFAAWGNGDYLYVYKENGDTLSTVQPVEFVTLGERAIRLNDYNLKPSLEYPIATYIDNQIVINPSDISKIQMIYVRYPSTPKWDFLVNTNDQEVYKPIGSPGSTSKNLEFPNLDWENIANIAVKYISIFLRESELYGAIDKRIISGQ